jgi:hypothetical protein
MVRNYNIGTTSLYNQVEEAGIYAGGKILYISRREIVFLTQYMVL